MLEIRRPWRQNPDRIDLDLKLELPERIARASCSRNARGARPARAQDPIQFRSPRSRHPHSMLRHRARRPHVGYPPCVAWTREHAPNAQTQNACYTPLRARENKRFARDTLNISCRKSVSTGTREHKRFARDILNNSSC